MTTAPCSTLTEFLKKYDYKTSKCPDKIITHTKIPGKGVTKGGSFYLQSKIFRAHEATA